MLPRFRKLSLTQFRADASAQIAWVEYMGGHIWITRHGRIKAVVVPLCETQMLDKLLTWNEAEMAADLEAKYSRWKSAKALQAIEHRRRLADGWETVSERFLDDG